MLLVVGGVASGKRTYVRSLGYDDAQMSTIALSEAPVLLGLEEALRDAPCDDQMIDALCHKDVVVCCEVGMGVVPMDAEERSWRERVGRTCTVLAARAEKVVRMVCGIPVTIKG